MSASLAVNLLANSPAPHVKMLNSRPLTSSILSSYGHRNRQPPLEAPHPPHLWLHISLNLFTISAELNGHVPQQ